MEKTNGDTVTQSSKKDLEPEKYEKSKRAKLTILKTSTVHTHCSALPEPILRIRKQVETYEKYIHTNLPSGT